MKDKKARHYADFLLKVRRLLAVTKGCNRTTNRYVWSGQKRYVGAAMILPIGFGVLVGLAIPAVICFVALFGMDSKSRILRGLTAMPMGAFIFGFIGFFVSLFFEKHDTLGNNIGNSAEVWIAITVLGALGAGLLAAFDV